jgi:hypothetical protein
MSASIMLRRTTITLSLVTLLGALAPLSGCVDDEIITPTRYLERPNAVDFFCVGVVSSADASVLTGMPDEACDASQDDSDRWLFGLVVNSARSEVAMVDMANQNPGYGFVPVGENPVGVRVTEDGCAAYVTNHGSCDISVLNINRTLHAAGFDVAADSAPGAATGRIAVRTPTGRLLARPHELVLRPEYLSAPPPIQQCGSLEGHRAYVSLPGCGLVVEVDLDSGRVLQSLRFDGGTAQNAGIDPVCPAECLDWHGDGAIGGGLAEDRPGPLLVTRDGMRLVIGSVTRPEVTIVDLDMANGQFLNARTIQLAAEDRGVRRIRQSPYTWKSDFYFFYVVTRSGVIHVIDADSEQECETNPDPADPFFPEAGTVDPAEWEAWEPAKGCLALSDPNTPERAPGVDTPAIVMPGQRMAVDVSFAEVFHDGYGSAPDSLLASYYLGGTYAYAVTLDGLAYLINVDEIYPRELAPDDDDTYLNHRRGDGIYAILSHQLRTSLNTDGVEGYNGRPRVASDDSQQLYVDDERISDDELEAYDHVASGLVPTVDILDPYRAATETWSLTYMGVLPRADRNTGQIIRHDLSGLGPDQAEFRDVGVGFCWAGVKDGDVLELAGCADDDDCNQGFYCYRSFVQSVGTDGLCLAVDARDSLSDLCEGLAVTPRRWEIQRAEDDRLIIGPLEVSDATACVDEDLAGYCCELAVNEPGNGNIAGVLLGGRCVASPLPDPSFSVSVGGGDTRTAACFEGLLRYSIRVAPEQYLLVGSRTGARLEGVPDAADDGYCIDDPDVDPVVLSRVERVEGTSLGNEVLAFELALGSTVHPSPDFNILFDITAGFEPRVVDVSARLPAVVEEAPDGYLYVIDQGDENVIGGLQGQVLRLLPGDIALDTGFVVR